MGSALAVALVMVGPAAAAPVLIDAVPAGSYSLGVAASRDGTRLYVANEGGTLSVIDTTNNPPTLLSNVPTGTTPFAVALSPDGTRAYVTNRGDKTLSVVDTTTNPPSVTSSIAVGSSPWGVAVSPDGSRAYVPNNDGSSAVSVVDTTTNPPSVIDTVIAGASPSGVAVSPTGKQVYVTNFFGNTVSVIDTTTNPPSIGHTINVGDGPLWVDVAPDGRAYVANYFGNSVSVIDTTANPPAVSATVSVGTEPYALATSADGTRVFVTNNGDGSMSSIDTTANPPAVSDTVAAGDKPSMVAVSPDGSRAYVSNFIASGTISFFAVQPSPPTAVMAVASDSEVTANWSAPTYTGGQPITSYTATAHPDGKTCSTSGSTTCTIKSLTNGTSYTVTVRATNSIGTSAASLPSNAVTPAAPAPGPTPTPTPTPTPKLKQTLKPGLPKRIKVTGLTVLTPANARTNAGQSVRTVVRGGPAGLNAAGQVRYFTVVRGRAGKTSVRTYGYPDLRLRVVQNAPATKEYTAFKRQASYLRGARRAAQVQPSWGKGFAGDSGVTVLATSPLHVES